MHAITSMKQEVTRVTQKGRPRIDPAIVSQIQEWTADGWGASAVLEKLKGDDRYRSRAPSLRTISKYAAPIRRRQDSPSWALERAPDDASLVVPAIREMIERSQGYLKRMSVDEARWVARIRAAAPSIPISSAYIRARAMTYVPPGEEDEAEESLQAFLAFEPWSDGAKAYNDAFNKGWIRTFLVDPSTSDSFGSGHPNVLSISQPDSQDSIFGDIEVTSTATVDDP